MVALVCSALIRFACLLACFALLALLALLAHVVWLQGSVSRIYVTFGPLGLSWDATDPQVGAILSTGHIQCQTGRPRIEHPCQVDGQVYSGPTKAQAKG